MKWIRTHLGETVYRAVRTATQAAAGVIAAGIVHVVTSGGASEAVKSLIVLAVATGLSAAMNTVAEEDEERHE